MKELKRVSHLLFLIFIITSITININARNQQFPYTEFLKVTGVQNKYVLSYCGIDYQCKRQYYCSCRDSCIRSQTCCMDYLWNSSRSISSHKQLMFSLKSVKKQSCLKFFLSHNVIVDQFIMVNSCPLGADKRFKSLCFTGKTLPVYRGR